MTDCEHPAYKSVMIHASAVEYKSKALIFLGPSKTGKSTLARLLAETVADVRVLADDMMDLDRQADGSWMASDACSRIFKDTPGVCLAPVSLRAPLGAIFRLYQAPRPQLVTIPTSATCLHLIKAFTEVFPNQPKSLEEKKSFFACLATVARVVPGYELYFDRSAQTADMLRRETVFA